MKGGSGNIRGNRFSFFFLFPLNMYITMCHQSLLVEYLDIEVCEKQSRKVALVKFKIIFSGR